MEGECFWSEHLSARRAFALAWTAEAAIPTRVCRRDAGATRCGRRLRIRIRGLASGRSRGCSWCRR